VCGRGGPHRLDRTRARRLQEEYAGTDPYAAIEDPIEEFVAI